MVNPHGETYGICKNKCLVEVSPKEDVVHKSGDETIPGNKTFTGNVTFGTSGSPRQVSLKGDLVIDGNISQSGANYETHAEEVYTKQDKIILRDGAVAGLGVNERTGFTFKKYDGTNDGNLVVGADGTAYVGDTGDLQPILTRAPVGSMVNGKPIVWDSAGARAVTTNAIDNALALKADKTEVAGLVGTTEALALKADKTEVDAKLALKADKTEVALKADKTELALKQDKLTFDSSPVEGSSNPVTSGGVYTALKADEAGLVDLRVVDGVLEYRYNGEWIGLNIIFPKCSELLTMFKSDTTLIESPPINAKYCTTLAGMFSGCSNLTTVGYIVGPNVTDMDTMFYSCTSLTTIPLLDTSNVTTMREMFRGCSSLTTIPLLDTSNVPTMENMFYECSSLTTIPLLDTSSVTNMNEMFNRCTSLTTIPLLDTSSVTDMSEMFRSCPSLTTIPLLDTSSVTNMSSMFRYCTSLTTIPILNTSNVTTMENMFYDCYALTTIPLLNISNVTNMQYLFRYCTALTSVTFECTNVRTYGPYMFQGTPIESNSGRIYVPDNLVQSYRNASGWKVHKSIIFGHSDKP